MGNQQTLFGGFLKLAGGTLTGLLTLNGQLAFPATQNPSAGANVLDDYEEGTWTPTVLFGSASVGITYSTQLGRYTKIGRLVTVTANIVLTSKGSSTGAAQIGGLPFTSANDTMSTSAAVGLASGFTSVVGAVALMVSPNFTRLNCFQSNSGAGAGLTNANFSNTTNLYFTASYDAAA